jgi:hypothetical protein
LRLHRVHRSDVREVTNLVSAGALAVPMLAVM